MSADSQYSEKASVTTIRTLLYPSIMPLLTLKKTLNNNNNKMTAEVKTAVILLLFCYYFMGIQSFLGSLLFRVFRSGSSVGSFSRVWF